MNQGKYTLVRCINMGLWQAYFGQIYQYVNHHLKVLLSYSNKISYE